MNHSLTHARSPQYVKIIEEASFSGKVTEVVGFSSRAVCFDAREISGALKDDGRWGVQVITTIRGPEVEVGENVAQ